jgi:hypothetical protein
MMQTDLTQGSAPNGAREQPEALLEARLPWPSASAIIVATSLSLWTAVAALAFGVW